MSVWSFDDIAQATGGRWVIAPRDGDKPPLGAAIDSRAVAPGMLFAAFEGEHADGHAYLSKAREAGAVLALVTHADRVDPGLGIPVLAVENATSALESLARRWRAGLVGLRVIGVTGSNGKTTTSRMIHAAACGPGGLPGTRSAKSFNNELGVPITVLNARPGDRVLVCEIGMSTPGEIAARCSTARPDAAVITTVAEAHAGGFGGDALRAIAKEKASIAAGVPAGGVVVVPAGLPVLDEALAALTLSGEVVRVGDTDADVALGSVASDLDGVSFEVDGAPFAVPVPGAHNATNAALAVVMARWLGVGDDAIRAGLASMSSAPMRLERSVIPSDPPITLINDAYNANPGSVLAAIGVLAASPGSRRVAVLGDMLELGDRSEAAHRSALEACRAAGIELVLTVGEAYADAGGIGERSKDDGAIERVCGRIEPGDVVLIKGSRGMRMERVAARLSERFGVTHSARDD